MRKNSIYPILCVICVVIAVYYYQYAQGFTNYLTLAAQNQSFDNTVLSEAVRNNMAAAWHESKNQIIFAVDNQRSCQTDVIALYGCSHYILPYGKNLHPEQSGGCIISQTLAEELFASHQAEGQKINYAGHEWRIYDVIERPERLFLFEAAGLLDEAAFDHINIPAEKDIPARLTAERFISKYGVSAYFLRLDFYSSLSWLTEMIPTKWSDFEGWKQSWKNKKQEIYLLSNAEKSSVQSMYLHYITNSYCFGCMAGVLFIITVRTFSRYLLRMPERLKLRP